MSGIRLLRGALLLLLAAVVASVFWSLRRPRAPAAAAEPSAAVSTEAPVTPAEPVPGASRAPAPTRMGDVVYRAVKGGRESFVLRAKSMSGREQEQLRLSTVAADFSYTAHGEPGKGRIVSDQCIYYPTRQEAHFQGHVHLETDDGMELVTEELVYSGQDGWARSDQKLTFNRRRLAGRAERMSYETKTGRLELEGDVLVRGTAPGEPGFEIRSRRGTFEREQGEARFEDEVVLTRAGDVLHSDGLTLYGAEDEIDRVRAAGNVRVRSTGAALLGRRRTRAGTARPPGPRDLSCQQLDIDVRPDRSLQEAVASGDAVLVVEPRPGETEKRTLKGSVLTFRFDEQERLTEVQGQKDAEFLGEPLSPAKGSPRRMRSRNFVVSLDPATGATRSAEFNKDVVFERGTLWAQAARGAFDGAEAKLTLNDEPSLVDTDQGSKLEAETIEIFVQSGDLRARHGVRHTIERRGARGATIPGSDADTSVVSARLFEYQVKTRTATYREGALLRSGRSELRAAEIRRVDAGPGQGRLEAKGDVVTLLYPRETAAGAPKPPVDGRAQEMRYDDARREIVYKGDVTLVQGEVRTKSPEAIVTLGQENGDVERLSAFDPVELRQGTRTVSGQRALYTPADRTIVVTGDKVQLNDETQEAKGRTLTFFVGEDRILVDGREEARTETILRRKP